MIKRAEGIDQDIKEEANQKILDEFRDEKRALLKEIEKEKNIVKQDIEEEAQNLKIENGEKNKEINSNQEQIIENSDNINNIYENDEDESIL